MSQARPQFDPNDPKYRCCCGGYHIMSGATVLAIISTAGTVIIAVSVAVMFDAIKHYLGRDNFLFEFLGILLLDVLVLGCLWYGLIKERKGFLVPVLICMASVLMMLFLCALVLLLGWLIAIIVIIAKMFSSTPTYGWQDHHSRSINLKKAMVLLFFYLLPSGGALMLQYWFFSIIESAYDYIKHKCLSSKGNITYIQQSEQVYIAVPKENPEP
uniref:Lysosomal-associated transmembrane protein 4A n=1 Tax=Plectus sambesii TaxID=2011161 RepID=A0A914WG56_9BILA